MKPIVVALFASLAIQSAVLADVSKSIFDDDWKPAAPEQVQPPGPTPPPVAAPKPATPSYPTPPIPAPAVGPRPAPEVRPPAPVSVRLAVPSASAQADAWKLIKEDIYKGDIANARTPAQKAQLAQKLLAVAGETTKDVVGKYVLLAQAKDLAISSGDPPTAFKCLDEMGKSFDIDYPLLKLDLFAALAKTVITPEDCQTVVDGLNGWADGQVNNDRYDTATKACDIALAVARKGRETGPINQTQLHQKRIGEIETAYLAAKPAMVSLAGNPTDPAANLTLGRFYCFIKGDWDRGLPMLALGNDAGLKSLAQTELTAGSGADAQVESGDSWWGLVEKEKGLSQDRIREHAIKLYAEALPNLDGLVKLKVEKRVSGLQAKSETGKIINLLKTIDDKRDIVQGRWDFRDGVLTSDDSSFAKIEFPYQPPAEYDYKVVFTRMSGDDDSAIMCLASQHQFELQIGGWHNTVIGFGMVGNALADHNPSAHVEKSILKNGQQYTAIVKVRRGSVQAYLDGTLMSELKTNFMDMSLEPAWKLRHNNTIGLGSLSSRVAFQSAEITEVSGSGKMLK